MKKFTLLLTLFLTFTSCKEQRKVSIQTISQEEFAKLDLNAIQLLDVRTPNEISRGTINGAVEINLFDHDFTERVLSKFEKDQPLYIYCAAGGRSGKACSKLVLEGFDEVYNLQGGYSEWVQLQKE